MTLAPGTCARKYERVEASPANLVTATSSTEVLKWLEASRTVADELSNVEAIQVNPE